MSLIYDKTGFPLVEVEINVETKKKLFVHVLPVTKIQFEKFMSDSNIPDFNDEVYEGLLKLNPRVSYRKFTKENYWNLFVTGVFPEEAVKFAEYLGDDYRIPSVEEWCEIYKYSEQNFRGVKLDKLCLEEKTNLQKKSGMILKGLKKCAGDDLFNISIIENGILEWAKERGKYVGKGMPNAKFWPNTLNPLIDIVRPAGKERLHCVGFRLVKDKEVKEDEDGQG